ncbi:MAG: hypothetical protein U0X92_12650 [Anaerolineales bacterium]
MQTARIVRNTLITAVVIAAFAVSYKITGVDFPRLFANLPNGKNLLVAFLTPDVASRDVETRTVSISSRFPAVPRRKKARSPRAVRALFQA